ncbi:MAG: Nif3-like dinuclear metal center hexameric protein, partial [Bacteroidetes bacterium]
MPTITDVIEVLESIAPPVYQESYDNAGLIVGDPNAPVRGVLCCLDAIEEVVDEAIRLDCNLVVAHHPIVFRGLKRLTGANYVERTVLKAIKHDVAIYAIHTNLDNVLHRGVNERIAQRLGLTDCRILAPKQVLQVAVWHFAEAPTHALVEALEELPGTACQTDGPRVEVRYPTGSARAVHALMAQHGGQLWSVRADERPADQIGSGLVGLLPEPMPETAFLDLLKERMQTGCIRHTRLLGKPVRRVALCGGAGGFLLRQAIAVGADFFVTADYKYHEFFDADNQIVIADIGHYESE